MSDPAGTTQVQQRQRMSLLASLVLLPFHLFGLLCGSLLLSVTVECVGLFFFWPEEGERHAQEMLAYELEQFPEHFKQSMWVEAPGEVAREWVSEAHDWIFVRSGLSEWMQKGANPVEKPARDFRFYLGQAFVQAKTYLIAAAYTVLVVWVRLLVVAFSLPLFLMAAGVGLVDGLVRRDVRRFGAGRESGFVYHRARASLVPLAMLPWVIYPALPASVSPLLILFPCAFALGVAVCVSAASFKKYL